MSHISKSLLSSVRQLANNSIEFLVAPPAPYLVYLATNLKNASICAQDVSSVEDFGAYTGEYSAKMLKEASINYSIVGHSERRVMFMETNRIVGKKFRSCINAGITPIICVGEDIENRKNNNYKELIATQIMDAVPKNTDRFIVAYEPLWSIGSGITPTINEIAEIFHFIKTDKKISQLAKNARLVYGGSVNSSNSQDVLAIANNDGIMLGSASLEESELKAILNNIK